MPRFKFRYPGYLKDGLKDRKRHELFGYEACEDQPYPPREGGQYLVSTAKNTIDVYAYCDGRWWRHDTVWNPRPSYWMSGICMSEKQDGIITKFVQTFGLTALSEQHRIVYTEYMIQKQIRKNVIAARLHVRKAKKATM
jgi:hypothetical protein